MKVLQIALVCVLIASAMAADSQLQATLTNLVNMQARAVDAVDSALDLLRSLKQANVDAQDAANQKMQLDELTHGQMITDLRTIADANKKAGDDATAHRKHIQEEIQTTQENLVWITNRRTSIINKKESLREHRCYANMMFVKALKEHDEALEVVRWLREDIEGIVSEDNNEGEELAQIKSSAGKLQAYAHLFTQNQIKEFAALSKDGNAREEVDAETAEYDEDATDNTRSKLDMERMGAGTDARNVGQKLLDAVDMLEEHLISSMKDLEKSEIRAAWDLSQWLQDSEQELVHLDEEQATKTTYIDKLLIAIIGAKAREDKSWEIYFESAAALNDAVAALDKLRAWHKQETERRTEENNLLDEVIAMFIAKVGTIDKNMRGKVNDFSEDGDFDNKIARGIDSISDADGGSLAANVAAESRQ